MHQAMAVVAVVWQAGLSCILRGAESAQRNDIAESGGKVAVVPAACAVEQPVRGSWAPPIAATDAARASWLLPLALQTRDIPITMILQAWNMPTRSKQQRARPALVFG